MPLPRALAPGDRFTTPTGTTPYACTGPVVEHPSDNTVSVPVDRWPDILFLAGGLPVLLERCPACQVRPLSGKLRHEPGDDACQAIQGDRDAADREA